MSRLSDENMQRLRTRWKSCNNAPYRFPEDGGEARSVMACLRDCSGLRNLMASEEGLPRQDAIKYAIGRRLANHYNVDVSDLPTRLTANERGNIAIV